MSERRVIILRGIPGSGKTTYQQTAFPGAALCSADWFFVGDDGVYRFEPTKLGKAHDACMSDFLALTGGGVPLIVVDNTNLSLWEVTPYLAVGKARGYSVSAVRVDCDPLVAAARNAHGVPADRVLAMASRFEPIPPFLGCPETVVSGMDEALRAAEDRALRQLEELSDEESRAYRYARDDDE